MASKTGRVGGATRHLSIEERFWIKVDKRGPDECWPWLGGATNQGYGRFVYNGKYITAQRASWLIHYGEIPAELVIHHTCHNPSCVNPAHLQAIPARHNLARRKLHDGRRQFMAQMDALAAGQAEGGVVEISLAARHRWWLDQEAVRRGVSRDEVLLHVLDSYLRSRLQSGGRIFD